MTASGAPALLTVSLVDGASERTKNLKGWSLTDLGQLKAFTSRERDPQDGKVVSWKGVLLSTLVNEALESVPAEKKAQIDLLILRSEKGAQALVPRSFVARYPMMLAFERESTELTPPVGPLYSVAPWTSSAKIQQEGFPLESFFIPQVKRIELANYRDKYGEFFLKRRTDPSAMRGEKLFVQACITCHATGQGPAVSALSKSDRKAAHPEVKGAPQLTERDRRSLDSYLDAYAAENGGGATAAIRSALKAVSPN